jgi:hypothetical protein
MGVKVNTFEIVKKSFEQHGEDGVAKARSEIENLVHSQSEEAKDFFLSILNPDKPAWTQQALRFFTVYKNKNSREVLEKIKHVIKTKTFFESDRMRAINILGSTLKEVDPILFEALSADPDEVVKAAAFSAIVEIQTDYWTGENALSRVESGELEPTLENAEKIIEEWKKQNA